MIPLRRSDMRVEKSPFLAAIRASSRSSSCSSGTEPFAAATGAVLPVLPLERLLPLPEAGCEVARRVVVFAAVVAVTRRDFERAWATCLPLLELVLRVRLG